MSYGVWRKAGNSLWTHRYGDRTYCCIFKECRPVRAHEQDVGCCYDVGVLFVFLRLSVDKLDLLLSFCRNVPVSLCRCGCSCIQSLWCSTGSLTRCSFRPNSPLTLSSTSSLAVSITSSEISYVMTKLCSSLYHVIYWTNNSSIQPQFEVAFTLKIWGNYVPEFLMLWNVVWLSFLLESSI